MAWILIWEFYVAVKNQHLVVLPVARRFETRRPYADAIYANFDEVYLNEGPIGNTILDIRKMYKGEPLNLRY
jgi:hypothetical protein